jgi:predicted HTH domain antitoxin
MIVEIPDQIIKQSGLSAKEILLKDTLVLFQEEKLTLRQASRLAGLHQYEFQKELAERNIPVHYDEEDYRRDLQTIRLIKGLLFLNCRETIW